MKHTNEELAGFEEALAEVTNPIWTLLDGDMDDGGENPGAAYLTVEQYAQAMTEYRGGIFRFLLNHLDLDVALRMELTGLLAVMVYPLTDKERADDLRGWAMALSDVISQEAYSDEDRADWWLVSDEGIFDPEKLPRITHRTAAIKR